MSRPTLPPDADSVLDLVRALARELRPGLSGIEHLGLEHALERDFGLDSLARIERDLGVRLAEAALAEAEAETPRDLLRLMAGAACVERGHGEVAAPVQMAAVQAAGGERPPDSVATLTGLLDWHVARHGEQVHITLYGEAERSEDISYRMLRVAIMLPTGREFFAAFYGALYAGCVPVPLYPPARPSLLEDHMRRIAGIVSNAEAALQGLDLSSWRLAYNGAEPVSPDTLARFAPYGCRADAMTPVYGLAESSVGLAFPPPGRGPLIDRIERAALSTTGIARVAPAEDAHALRIVACGRALPGHAIRVVDAHGGELPERGQGRVQFCGPSATCGYFRNPEATARLIDGDWLNSGDLGYLAAGGLYLAGREKDIIIRGGHNIYPQELEEAVSRLPGVRRGGVAVFPASDARAGTERLVLLAETREADRQARDRIVAESNRLALDLTGLPADDIVLAPPRSVLKTSSGKVRRAACRERHERGDPGRDFASSQRPPWRQASAARRRRLGVECLGLVGFRLRRIRLLAPDRAGRIARAGALTGLRPQVEGLDHLAGSAAVIVVANHGSYLDALILTAVLPPRFAFVAKQELLNKPFAGIPLRRLAAAFVQRFDSAQGAEDALIFFPEGTFRDAPGLLPFRLGAFVAAAGAGVAVVPITLNGTRALLHAETWRPQYSKLQVRVSAPLAAQGEDWQAARASADSGAAG